jgi:hypothetical protein
MKPSGLCAFATFLTLICAGCGDDTPAVIPDPSADHAPTITVVGFPVDNVGSGRAASVVPEASSVPQHVKVNSGTDVLIFGSARNPGGVLKFTMVITWNDHPTPDVFTIVNDGKVVAGKAASALYTFGYAGSPPVGPVAQAGITPVIIRMVAPVTAAVVTATAENYNHQTSSITVNFDLVDLEGTR